MKGFSRVVVFYGESSKELRALSLLFAVHRIFLVFARLNPLHLVPLAACPDGGGEKRKWRDAVMTQSWQIGRNPGPEMALTTEATTQRKTREKETKRNNTVQLHYAITITRTKRNKLVNSFFFQSGYFIERTNDDDCV